MAEWRLKMQVIALGLGLLAAIAGRRWRRKREESRAASRRHWVPPVRNPIPNAPPDFAKSEPAPDIEITIREVDDKFIVVGDRRGRFFRRQYTGLAAEDVPAIVAALAEQLLREIEAIR